MLTECEWCGGYGSLYDTDVECGHCDGTGREPATMPKFGSVGCAGRSCYRLAFEDGEVCGACDEPVCYPPGERPEGPPKAVIRDQIDHERTLLDRPLFDNPEDDQ